MINNNDAPQLVKYSELLQEILLLYGLTMVFFFSLLYVLTQILFFAGITVHILTLCVSILLSLVFLVSTSYSGCSGNIATISLQQKYIQISFIVGVLILISAIFSIGIEESYIDDSWDSNVYHLQYPVFFLHGWNPVLNFMPVLFNGKIMAIDAMNNTYPKAAELIGSFFFLLTSQLESVKAIHYLIFFSCLSITIPTVLSFLPSKWTFAILISGLIAGNPVWVSQSLLFYIDGFTGELIIIIIFLMILCLKSERKLPFLITINAGILLLLGVKGTSLLYVPILLLMFVYLFWRYQKNQLRTVIVTLIIPLIIVSCIICYSPYIQNFQKTGNPLGEGFTNTSPEAFTKLYAGYSDSDLPGWISAKKLFVLSLFSPVSQVYTGVKNPLTIGQNELEVISSGENRINGYGPLCGLIIILSIIALISLISGLREQNIQILLICITFIFISVILHPTCWWARFVPHFFLIPPLIALTGVVKGGLISKTVSWLIIGAMILNIIIIGYSCYHLSIIKTDRYNGILQEIQETALLPVGIQGPGTGSWSLPSFRLTTAELLQENGISWEICDDKYSCSDKTDQQEMMFFSSVRYNTNTGNSTYIFGDAIRFEKGGNSFKYTESGWSSNEGPYRWTNGKNATMKFWIEQVPETIFLNLDASSFVTPQMRSQRVLITINGKALPHQINVSEDHQIYSVPIYKMCIRGLNTIRFSFPDAISPRDLGISQDSRILGIAVRSISFTSQALKNVSPKKDKITLSQGQ